MKVLSFRVADSEATEPEHWAQTLGVDRSEILRDAVHRHLVRLRAEEEAATWASALLRQPESSLAEIADRGPAEDWADWTDAAR